MGKASTGHDLAPWAAGRTGFPSSEKENVR